jgi:magnesium chelatase accessory protein
MRASSASAVEPTRDQPADRALDVSGRFVDVAGIRWFVRSEGHGPVLLLLHGTGSSSASWRDLIPLLSDRFTLVAPDLPGHGRTSAVPRGPSSLPVMAHALAVLMRDLGLDPEFVAGHSAGAAISAQMVLAETPSVQRLAWIAPALVPFEGIAGLVAPSLARLLSGSSTLAHLVAWRARSDSAVRRMIASTGSTLDERGVDVYGALLRSPFHVSGSLAMMAGWDLAPLNRALPLIRMPVLLMHGERDGIVPASQSDQVAATLANARLERLAGLGHLAHEEQPQRVARLLAEWFGTIAP